METRQQKKIYPFLQGGGEMGEMIRNYNWSKTPLGSPDKWPQSLRISLGNVLNSGFPMFLFWGNDLISFYNDAFRPSLGVDGKHPAIGKKAKEIWEEIWDFVGPLIMGVMENGKPVWFKDQLIPFYRNGRIEDIYWTFSYSLILNDEGLPGGVLVTCMETTDSVAVLKQLRESELRFRTLADDSPMFVFIIDTDPLATVSYWNRTWLEYTGQTMEEAKGRAWDGIIHPEDVPIVMEHYAPAFQNKKPYFIPAVRVKRHDGEYRWHAFKGNPRYLTEGEFIGYVGVGLDIHEQKITEEKLEELVEKRTEELQKANKELQRSNQNLEEFAHAASHDLQEPVRKIHFFTQHLKEQLSKYLNDVETSAFNRIENATERMHNLIDDLLLYSHVSQRPQEMESIDLNLKLQRVLEDLELDIQEKRAVITAGKLPTIKGYRRQWQQVFQNLLSNALKYSKTDVPPRIEITANEVTEHGRLYHLISVKDNGIGFEQQYEERIFQMFSRLHGRSEYNGTGVGLSIVKKVIENHNGFIRVESKPGVGSTFNIYLPVEYV
ncbi:MAG: ATP-binding protein [Flavisolibacter sp.]